jgi:hypothetical protein
MRKRGKNPAKQTLIKILKGFSLVGIRKVSMSFLSVINKTFPEISF